MTNHQDKELSSDPISALHAIACRKYSGAHHGDVPACRSDCPCDANKPFAASPQFPVAEQPAGQVRWQHDQLALELSGTIMGLLTQEYKGGDSQKRAAIQCAIIDALSPVAQMSGDVDGWSVTVEVNGQNILCISDKHVAGLEDLDPYTEIIGNCAQHLNAFMGASHPSNADLADAYTRGRADGWEAAKLKYAANAVQDAPVTIDDFHKHEVLDRTHVIQTMLNELLDGHPAMTPALQAFYEKSVEAVGALYQAAGNEHFSEPAATVPQVVQAPSDSQSICDLIEASLDSIGVVGVEAEYVLNDLRTALKSTPQPVAASPSIVPSTIFDNPIEILVDDIVWANIYFRWRQDGVGFGEWSCVVKGGEVKELLNEGMGPKWSRKALESLSEALITKLFPTTASNAGEAAQGADK